MSATHEAPSVHGFTCIHQVFDPVRRQMVECGEPTALDKPHGWLCGRHERAVNRTEVIERTA